MKQVRWFCDVCGNEIDGQGSVDPKPINFKSCDRDDIPIDDAGFVSHPCETCREKIHDGMRKAFVNIIQTIKKEKK